MRHHARPIRHYRLVHTKHGRRRRLINPHIHRRKMANPFRRRPTYLPMKRGPTEGSIVRSAFAVTDALRRIRDKQARQREKEIEREELANLTANAREAIKEDREAAAYDAELQQQDATVKYAKNKLHEAEYLVKEFEKEPTPLSRFAFATQPLTLYELDEQGQPLKDERGIRIVRKVTEDTPEEKMIKTINAAVAAKKHLSPGFLNNMATVTSKFFNTLREDEPKALAEAQKIKKDTSDAEVKELRLKSKLTDKETKILQVMDPHFNDFWGSGTKGADTWVWNRFDKEFVKKGESMKKKLGIDSEGEYKAEGIILEPTRPTSTILDAIRDIRGKKHDLGVQVEGIQKAEAILESGMSKREYKRLHKSPKTAEIPAATVTVSPIVVVPPEPPRERSFEEQIANPETVVNFRVDDEEGSQ